MRAFLFIALIGCSAPVQEAVTTTTGGGGAGGTGGQPQSSTLDALLTALREERDAALLDQSRAEGWPAPVENGYLIVSSDVTLDRVGGDHDEWGGAPMEHEDDFAWAVFELAPGGRYKLTDGTRWEPDSWSRSYAYDEYGEMSMLAGQAAHLERHFQVQDENVEARTLRVWIPEETATHVLYLHDGQNLFGGGWRLDESVPPAMMLVGIDNTAARMDEYTHVQDRIQGELMGGSADAYADYLETHVRPLVAEHYQEPAVVGVMGSSLGGLVSFHMADRFDGYAFAASLSGTMGWGSIGLDNGAQNETMIERYVSAGHRSTKLYLDSGGGGPCADSDGDGIEDDEPGASDNYCENMQLADVLRTLGYVDARDLWHWHEPGAEHNEAAWAARVWRPLGIFADLR